MVTSSEADKIEQLVKNVGVALQEFWPGNAQSQKGRTLKVYDKADGSKVTEADLAANEILVKGLRELFPNDAIVSEEGPKDQGHQAMARVWIVDPLDGTNAFIAGRDDFSVLVGLVSENKVAWGCMYFPVKGVFAKAGRGAGAELFPGGAGKVSEVVQVRPQSIYYRYCELKAKSLLYPDPMDSGMAFLALCRGELDGIIMRMQSHQEWDLAAPAVILLESGGVMTDERGEAILFNQKKIGFKYLVASNGKVHRQLLELIGELE